MRRAGVATATFAFAAWLACAGASAQEPSLIVPGAGIDLVRLDVIALDRDGHPVSGLRPEDFEIVEDGQPLKVVSFEPVVVKPALPAAHEKTESEPGWTRTRASPRPDAGRQLLVFFDDVHLSPVSAERARAALGSYLAGANEGDWTLVVAPESGVWWAARDPSEHRLLGEIIARLSGHLVRDPFHGTLTEWEAMQVVEYGRPHLARPASPTRPVPGQPRSVELPSSGPVEVYDIAQRRIRKSLRALGRAIDALAGLNGHKSLVMVSEGFILSPSLSREYDRVIDGARRAHVAVHFVDPTGLASGLAGAEDPAAAPDYRPPGVMRQGQVAGAAHVSLATGGREHFTNEVVDGMRQALEESSAYYLLGFEPPPGRDGERRIRVRVLRPGVDVRSRDRYFVKPLARPDSPIDRALRAVTDESALPLRVTASLGGRSRKGEVETTLVVDLAALPAPLPERRLRFVVEARRSDGHRAGYKADSRLPASGEPRVSLDGLRLLPGLWQIRLVVQDEKTKALGSVLHTLRVPEFHGSAEDGQH